MDPDPLHVCIALGPLAVYLFLLGLINLSRRPFLTTGARDAAALGVGISGFVVVGPMELFLPGAAANRFGGYVWLLLLAFYALCLTLWVLLLRPRLVIYNATAEQLRPVLAGVDPAQRMRTLLEEREPFYLLAHHTVQTEHSAPEVVAAEVMGLARHHGGW